jgi:predicted amidohydrolase YtcJ
LLAIAIAVAAGCTRDQDRGTNAPADLALKNGAIYTVDSVRSWAEAVAIKDGRVVFVGSTKDAEAHIGDATQVVDLQGRMVVPGFQDVHIHPISGGIEANACDLNGLETIDEYLAKIKDYADTHPDEPWITGGGWFVSAFGPGALARKELLDAIVPDRPVFLESVDGHSSWVNSKALEIAGITKETPDPPNGRIDRDPQTGEAIGSLQEDADLLVTSRMPPDTDAEREAGLRYALKMLSAQGITGIQDANVDENELRAYRKLDNAGELLLRVVAALWWDPLEGLEQIEHLKRLRREYTGGRIDAGSVKIIQDGVLENYTGVVLDPYRLKGKSDERGIAMVEPELLKKAVTQLDADGFQVHFHAVGDGAVRQALDAIEAARTTNGDLGHRHHISHLQLIHPDDQPRFRRLGVIANFQPLWAMADKYITELTLPFISRQAASYLYPIGSMVRSGAIVAFGSDWSVSSANPFWQMETGMTRIWALSDAKTSWMPGERIGLAEALAAFTINAAYTNRDEVNSGSLEVGKVANLAVLDRNLFEIPVAELSDTQVLLTLFEGKAVHGKLEDL